MIFNSSAWLNEIREPEQVTYRRGNGDVNGVTFDWSPGLACAAIWTGHGVQQPVITVRCWHQKRHNCSAIHCSTPALLGPFQCNILELMSDNNNSCDKGRKDREKQRKRERMRCDATRRDAVVQLTVTWHADGQALFEAAILAAVAIQTEYLTLSIAQATVLDLLLDAAPEEALRRPSANAKTVETKHKRTNEKWATIWSRKANKHNYYQVFKQDITVNWDFGTDSSRMPQLQRWESTVWKNRLGGYNKNRNNKKKENNAQRTLQPSHEVTP